MLFQAVLCLTAVTSLISPAVGSAVPERSVLEPYQPYLVGCAKTPLVRAANALNADESAYIAARKTNSQKDLAAWIKKAWGSSTSLPTSNMPTVAMSLSGGGPKAGLISAGVIYGMDARDTSNGVSGLLQGLTYMSALSGGSLTLSSIMGNNFSRISTLKSNLYDTTYQNVLQVPLENNGQIAVDIVAKSAAGLPTSIIDIYGRGIAYDFIGGPGGANGVTWSGILKQSAFTSHQAPYPIITLSNTDVIDGQCTANSTGAVWEVAPYEFGSWDPAVQAFVPSQYLGTTIVNGSSVIKGACITGFDNAGFISGMSSNILVGFGQSSCPSTANGTDSLPAWLDALVARLLPDLGSTFTESLYGLIPNPFYKYLPSYGVSSQRILYMEDGGDTGQGIPIFPFLQPTRNVDVIIAVDEGSDAGNVTNGDSIYDTYTRAQQIGLSRMPQVPTPDVYLAENLVKRAQFFGCHDKSVATLIYLPDGNETQTSSSTFAFTPAQIDLVFGEGADMATQGGDGAWPACLACGIMHKQLKTLPEVCTACLQEYCWTH